MTRILCLAAVFLAFYGIQHAAEPLPLTTLIDEPVYSNPKLSPDGTKLGAIVRRAKKLYLAEIDLGTLQPRPFAELTEETRMVDYWWKSQDLLLLLVADKYGWANFRSSDLRTNQTSTFKHLDYAGANLLYTLPDDPECVMIGTTYDETGWKLEKFNVRTGKAVTIENNSGGIDNWILDREGRPIAAAGSSRGKDFLLWRPAPDAKWIRHELGPSIHPNLRIVSIHTDQKRLIAWDFTGEGPARAVVLDPNTMTEEPLFANDTVDPSGVTVWGTGDYPNPRGVAFETDRPQLHYFNAKDEALQAMIDSALPDTINRIVSCSTDEQVMVISSYSDHDRGSYYLLDRRRKQMRALGVKYNGYDPAGPCAGRAFQFINRDGTIIHGRIVLPHNPQGKPPLIIMTSGGFAGYRTQYGFDAFDQILASRGYAVAKIDWRGTNGYGRAFQKSGDYQIDKGMPADLADGVRWLMQQGWIDEKRIALWGYGWGGVVAMHAMAQNAGLFTAWVNYGTPLNVDDLNYESFSMTPHKHGESEDELGGWRSARDFLSKVDPSPLVAKIAISSYHVYYNWPKQPSTNAARMESLLSKNPAVHVLQKVEIPEKKEEQQMLSVKTMENLLAYLNKTLGMPPEEPAEGRKTTK